MVSKYLYSINLMSCVTKLSILALIDTIVQRLADSGLNSNLNLYIKPEYLESSPSCPLNATLSYQQRLNSSSNTFI